MTARVQGQQRVFLLLADLSGYTEYVAASEPEHAPAMAGDLVEAVVKQLRPAFRLEKLEGDAAFLLAPVGDLDGARLLDAVDAAYDAFSRRIASLRQATTCDCESCRRVPDLDLKFVLHSGEVIRHRVAGRNEVSGAAAILAHRLLKATTPSRLGLSRYLLMTDVAAGVLGIDVEQVGATAATEAFEFLGEVPVHVLPLGGEVAGRRWAPPRNHAPLATTELELPAAPMTVWEELTSPARRPLWEGELQIAEDAPVGRRGVGTMTACVAGRLSSVEEILDWRPFEGFVRRATVDGVGRLTAEHILSPTPDGSRTFLQLRWYGPAAGREWAAAKLSHMSALATRLEATDANR